MAGRDRVVTAPVQARPGAACTPSADDVIALAIRHVNAGQPEQARLLCEHAALTLPPHPAVQQLLAVISLQRGDAAAAATQATASLAMRPGHAPTVRVATDAWFQLSLVRHDSGDLPGAAHALREVLRLAPDRAEAEVNLGIVLQDAGEIDEAMRAYGRAYRLREDTFGRIAHALAVPPVGRLWLHLDALRDDLRRA